MIAAIAAVLLAALIAGGTASTKQGSRTTPTAKPPAKHIKPAHCPAVQQAIGWHRQKISGHRAEMRLARLPPREWVDCKTAKRRLHDWQQKLRRSKVQLHRWHYAWWEWMPVGWQRLGACETGYGRRPGNFRHANGRFVSFAGISRRAYDGDAAYMGVPPWNDANPPTPHQQLLAAIGHTRLYGGLSGWGCRGAFYG